MLGFLMPFTARRTGSSMTRVRGSRALGPAQGATAETRKLYAQRSSHCLDCELEKDGDYGHHFDNVKMEFIRDHVAPLFIGQAGAGHAQVKDVGCLMTGS